MLQVSDMNTVVRNFLNTLHDGLYIFEGQRTGAYGHTRLPTLVRVTWNKIDAAYVDTWCENEPGEGCYRMHVNGNLGFYPPDAGAAQDREVLWERAVRRLYPDLTTADILMRVMTVPAHPAISWPLISGEPYAGSPEPSGVLVGNGEEEGGGETGSERDEAGAAEAGT